MTERRPLVIIAGETKELPTVDSLPGGVTSGTSTVTVGTTETNEASLVVIDQTSIASGAKVWAMIGLTATADYTADDHKYLGALGVSVTTGDVVAGVGFTIFIRSVETLTGDISINWFY